MNDDGLTIADRAEIAQRLRVRIDALIERAMYGGYPPGYDPQAGVRHDWRGHLRGYPIGRVINWEVMS